MILIFFFFNDGSENVLRLEKNSGKKRIIKQKPRKIKKQKLSPVIIIIIAYNNSSNSLRPGKYYVPYYRLHRKDLSADISPSGRELLNEWQTISWFFFLSRTGKTQEKKLELS